MNHKFSLLTLTLFFTANLHAEAMDCKRTHPRQPSAQINRRCKDAGAHFYYTGDNPVCGFTTGRWLCVCSDAEYTVLRRWQLRHRAVCPPAVEVPEEEIEPLADDLADTGVIGGPSGAGLSGS